MRTPTDILPHARKLPHFDAFLASRKTDKTRELYGYALAHLARFMSEQSVRLDGNNAWREPFCQWLLDNGFSKVSIPYHMSAVSSYLKFRKAYRPIKNTELSE